VPHAQGLEDDGIYGPQTRRKFKWDEVGADGEGADGCARVP
jgi:hypothetical protein